MTLAPEGADTSLSRSAAGMGAAAAVSRAFGGLRVVVIAAVLGTTFLGNAFQSSNSVSNVLFELLAAGALSAVLVPTFVNHLGRGEQHRAERDPGDRPEQSAEAKREQAQAVDGMGLRMLFLLGDFFRHHVEEPENGDADDRRDDEDDPRNAVGDRVERLAVE